MYNIDNGILNEVNQMYPEEYMLIGLEENYKEGIDVVVYDIYGMLETPKDFDDFHDIVRENALDADEMEVTRREVIRRF